MNKTVIWIPDEIRPAQRAGTHADFATVHRKVAILTCVKTVLFESLPYEENKGYRKNGILCFGDPDEIRTRVTAVKGRCLRPLDHRAGGGCNWT